MTKLIYETPTKQYQVYEVEGFFQYHNYIIEKAENKTIYIVRPSKKEIFQWLLDHRIISKDEFNHQTKSL